MAILTRSATPGSDWFANELAAYNISVVACRGTGLRSFFGAAALPEPSVPADILKKPEADMEDLDVSRTITVMNLVMVDPAPADLESEESAVVDFAIRLSDTLDHTMPDVTPVQPLYGLRQIQARADGCTPADTRDGGRSFS